MKQEPLTSLFCRRHRSSLLPSFTIITLKSRKALHLSKKGYPWALHAKFGRVASFLRFSYYIKKIPRFSLFSFLTNYRSELFGMLTRRFPLSTPSLPYKVIVVGHLQVWSPLRGTLAWPRCRRCSVVFVCRLFMLMISVLLLPR